MIDTPKNCFNQAAISNSAAKGSMLENVRRKHLASAAAWESLAAMLLGRAGDRHALALSKLPDQFPAKDSEGIGL